jgi:hypothetical protein
MHPATRLAPGLMWVAPTSPRAPGKLVSFRRGEGGGERLRTSQKSLYSPLQLFLQSPEGKWDRGEGDPANG